MATIFVDGRQYEVEERQNLLQACLSLKLNLPYFCWHPAFHSVGACRQCAVKQFRDENDTRGRIVMACMTPVTEATRISIEDPDAKAFRASVIEWLMINHPHDCPVCDEGSECHLQDMTLMTGHSYRRFRFKKRTYRNQYLGPFINHEMNRCIQCYRCVRYYRDYAGGRDLNVFAVHDNVYFGRYEDGVLESEFAGNLVEVCPTGVYTDRTFSSHYARKWDLQTAPSLCVHCSVGCNTIPGERYNELRRIRTRYNDQVNWNFLCDRGRFGYEFVNSPLRLRAPLIGGVRVTREEALHHLAEILERSAGVIGIGSPRATLESNFALRTLVGPDNFYLGMSDTESRLVSALLEMLRRGPAPSPSLKDVRGCDAVLVLGEDVTNVAPMLALALRQTVRLQPMKRAQKLKIPEWHDAAVRQVIGEDRGPFFLATVCRTRLEDVATRSYYGAPDDLARLGLAVARAVAGGDDRRPEGPLEAVRSLVGNLAETLAGQPLSEEVQALADTIARALMEAEQPLVVAGTSLGSEAILRAAANVAWTLHQAGRPALLSFVVQEANSMGLGLMGGGRLGDAFRAVQEGRADTVIVLENDLYRRADSSEVDSFLRSVRHLVALDALANATSESAEVALPAATYAESDGTLVNQEGRVQRFYQLFVPPGSTLESWRWLRDIMLASGRLEEGAWPNLDAITSAMVEALPVFAPVAEVAPPASFRIAGQRIAREHYRFSGRTAMTANIDVSEPPPPDDPDTPLAFSMEGYQGQPPSPLIPRFWAPGWNSGQSLHKFQEEVPGPLMGGDPGRRLIEPLQARPPALFHGMPAAFEPRDGEWLVVPLYHIFGSEEMSVLSPGIAELAPRSYLALNPEDAARLGLEDGQEIELPLGGYPRRLGVRLLPTLPPGVAGLPSGLPETTGIMLPTWSALS